MATNFFFNNFGNSQEQLLIEDLIIESIKIYGVDVFYIRRTTGAVDQIFNEDTTHSYTKAIMLEAYIKNIDGFGGDGDFLSKFNIQIRDTITFTIAQRVYNDEVATPNDDLTLRPKEGDLIYFPLNQKIFEIKFVEHEAIFYQLGALQTYDLKCELFEYSNERFDTGLAVVDELERKYGQTAELYLEYVNGIFEVGETITQELPSGAIITGVVRNVVANTLASVASYTLEVGRFNYSNSDIAYSAFQTLVLITGETSKASGTLLVEQTDSLELWQGDNKAIEEYADGIIDFTEQDPFSEGGTF